ncbi:hypothetical protein J3F83DRAFT_747510 [Trichoderma novae-zelandiae]
MTGLAVLLPPGLLDDGGQARQASHISRHSRSQRQQLRVGQGIIAIVMTCTEHADAAALRIAIWPSVTEIWTCYSGHKMPKACSWIQGRLQHRPAYGHLVERRGGASDGAPERELRRGPHSRRRLGMRRGSHCILYEAVYTVQPALALLNCRRRRRSRAT